MLLRGCPISNPENTTRERNRERDSPTSPTRARVGTRQNYPRHTRLSFTTKRHHVRCYHEHHRRARRQGTRRGRSRARDRARTRPGLTRLSDAEARKRCRESRHRRGVAAPCASDARVCRHRGVLNDTRGSNSGGSSAAGYVGAGAASSSPSRESPVGIGPTAEPAHNPRSTNIAPATRAPTRPLGHHDAGAPVSPPPRRGSASLASPVVAIGRGR